MKLSQQNNSNVEALFFSDLFLSSCLVCKELKEIGEIG